MALRAISCFAVLLSAAAITLVILIAVEDGETGTKNGKVVTPFRITYSGTGIPITESNTMSEERFREVLRNNGSLEIVVYKSSETFTNYSIGESDIPNSASTLRKIALSEPSTRRAATQPSPIFIFGKPLSNSTSIYFDVLHTTSPSTPQQDNVFLTVALIGYAIVMMTFSTVAYCSSRSKEQHAERWSDRSLRVDNDNNINIINSNDIRNKTNQTEMGQSASTGKGTHAELLPTLTNSRLRGISPPDREAELKTCETYSLPPSEPEAELSTEPVTKYKSRGPCITDDDFDKLSHLASLRASGEAGLVKENWEKVRDYTLSCGSTISLYHRKQAKGSLMEYLTFGELHCSAPLLFMLNNDVQYRSKWDEYCLDLNIIDSYDGVRDCSLYWKVKFPGFFSNRDYVFFREHRIHRGKIYSVSKSGSHCDYPPSRNPVRVLDFYNDCLLENSPKGSDWCLYTSLYFDDPRMTVPSRIMNWITATAVPQFIENMIKVGRKYDAKNSADLSKLVEAYSQ